LVYLPGSNNLYPTLVIVKVVIMQIFGIGPLELLLIILIMLILLGPKEMLATAYKIGQLIRKVVRSPMWATLMDTSREIRDLPKTILQETTLENDFNEIKKIAETPGKMIEDASKDLTVEIEPIEIPKISLQPTTPTRTPRRSVTRTTPPSSASLKLGDESNNEEKQSKVIETETILIPQVNLDREENSFLPDETPNEQPVILPEQLIVEAPEPMNSPVTSPDLKQAPKRRRQINRSSPQPILNSEGNSGMAVPTNAIDEGITLQGMEEKK
jgi:sec-independent protein translocase protein TatB